MFTKLINVMVVAKIKNHNKQYVQRSLGNEKHYPINPRTMNESTPFRFGKNILKEEKD